MICGSKVNIIVQEKKLSFNFFNFKKIKIFKFLKNF